MIVPKTGESPVIDGELTDTVWKDAAVLQDFRVIGSQESPKCKTTVRVLYDANNLYFSVLCYEPHMNKIADRFTEHDSPLWEGDDFEIRLAPRIAPEEKKSFPFYMFAFSPSGVQTEHLIVGHTVDEENAERVLGKNWLDQPSGSEWNGKWQVKTKKGAGAWTAEVVIPLKSINLHIGENVRILLARGEKAIPENSSWPLIIHGIFNNCSAFGALKWDEGGDFAQGIQIISAVYGGGGKTADVTKIVQGLVAAKQNIPVHNGTFKCDPAPGTGKSLEVKYSINGQVRVVSCPEQQDLQIPELK